MKNPKQTHQALLGSLLALLIAPALPTSVRAQDTTSASAPQSEPVKLSSFDVTASPVGPYQTAESTSGSRVALNLFDTTQSIYVATAAFIADTGSESPLDALQYFPGVSASTEPQGTAAERITIRGFQVLNSVTDGLDLTSGDYFDRNQEGAMLDRIEVVMGADSILNPTGVPGGTMNMVTKKPQYSNFGSAQVDFGEYGTNRGDIDINRVLSPHLAIRSITSGVRDDVYDVGYQHGFNNLTEASWRFGNGSALTLQHIDDWGKSENGAQKGLPIDPSTGPNNYPILLQGLSPDAGERLWANQSLIVNQESWTLLYTGQLSDHISTHFGARYETYTQDEELPQIANLQGTGGSYNPFTGLWVPGITYGPAPNFTPAPAVPLGPIYEAQDAISSSHLAAYTFQDDYAFDYQLGVAHSQTLVGVAGNYIRTTTFAYTGTTEVLFNIYTDVLPAFSSVPSKFTSTSRTYSDYLNSYVNEGVKLFKDDRVVLNLGVAKTLNYIHIEGVGYSSHPCPVFVNGGALVKVTPDIAVYYSHSESATPANEAPTAVPYVDLDTATMDEEGVRMKFLGGRGLATVSYYNLIQSNYPVINPLNESTPIPVPAFPELLFKRFGRGWEYNVNCAVTNELSAIISYTNFLSHDPFGVPFRSSSENSGAGWIHYERSNGSLKGFGLGLGYVHRGKTPADTPSPELATGSTPTHPIPNQSSFDLPASGIWNFTMSYRWNPHWMFRAFVDNFTDEKYFAASIGRTGVFPGTPINPRGSIAYSF